MDKRIKLQGFRTTRRPLPAALSPFHRPRAMTNLRHSTSNAPGSFRPTPEGLDPRAVTLGQTLHESPFLRASQQSQNHDHLKGSVEYCTDTGISARFVLHTPIDVEPMTGLTPKPLFISSCAAFFVHLSGRLILGESPVDHEQQPESILRHHPPWLIMQLIH
jgi:hypothetical protein